MTKKINTCKQQNIEQSWRIGMEKIGHKNSNCTLFDMQN
jgi:hypothetical protein